jgi:guanylate kinase
VVLEIDVQGAVQVIGREPSALLVFLVPPSTEELQRRMEERGDAPDKVDERLAVAAAERDEARRMGAVEIVNDDLEETLDAVQRQIRQARAHAARAAGES